MNRLAVWLATSLGAGYAPVAPGTVGSAVGVGIYLLTSHWTFAQQALLAGAITAIGVWSSTAATRHFGKEDPGPVVIDEVAGQLVTYLGTGVSVWGAVIGFGLFRLLDIVKPWPANKLEALPGGTGIMADDLMAAAYGCAMLHGIVWVVPGLR